MENYVFLFRWWIKINWSGETSIFHWIFLFFLPTTFHTLLIKAPDRCTCLWCCLRIHMYNWRRDIQEFFRINVFFPIFKKMIFLYFFHSSWVWTRVHKNQKSIFFLFNKTRKKNHFFYEVQISINLNKMLKLRSRDHRWFSGTMMTKFTAKLQCNCDIFEGSLLGIQWKSDTCTT